MSTAMAVASNTSERVGKERRIMALCRFSRRFDFQRSCIEWRYAQDSGVSGSVELNEPSTLFVALSSSASGALLTLARRVEEVWVVLQGSSDCVARSSSVAALCRGVEKVVWWLDPSSRHRPAMSGLRRCLGLGSARSVVLLGSLGQYEKGSLGVHREGPLEHRSTAQLLALTEHTGQSSSLTQARQLVLESATIDVFSAMASYELQQQRGLY